MADSKICCCGPLVIVAAIAIDRGRSRSMGNTVAVTAGVAGLPSRRARGCSLPLGRRSLLLRRGVGTRAPQTPRSDGGSPSYREPGDGPPLRRLHCCCRGLAAYNIRRSR